MNINVCSLLVEICLKRLQNKQSDFKYFFFSWKERKTGYCGYDARNNRVCVRVCVWKKHKEVSNRELEMHNEKMTHGILLQSQGAVNGVSDSYYGGSAINILTQ